MKYALIEGIKSLPQKGMVGLCPMCNADLLARCGNIKVHHWAHKNKIECDNWWETETLWHRDWKNLFPVDWQEIIHSDINGEKHIADVKTPLGLVLEFQHSFLNQDERSARESFYNQMIWIVDGTRRKRDIIKFEKGFKTFQKTNMRNVFYIPFPEESIPKDWLFSEKIVIFDFNHYPSVGLPLAMVWKPKNTSMLQCMLINKMALINLITTDDFLKVLEEN